MLNSGVLTGNASVQQNTTVGNISTGDAASMANVLNMLQSSWNPSNGTLDTFVANLNGNVTGDLLLDPSLISSSGSNSLNTTNNTTNNNLQVNNQTNGTINNNINLNAVSGNALVSQNTTAGNVSTGNADAVANIVNLINSAISAGHSFLGVLNINGNLNGDILLPQWLISGLTSNTGASSTNTANNTIYGFASGPTVPRRRGGRS